MAKELDNKKIWETILYEAEISAKMHPNAIPCMSTYVIEAALLKQGFEYKDGKIKEIEKTPEFKNVTREQFIEEACKWIELNILKEDYYTYADTIFGKVKITDSGKIIKDFRKALEKGE